jgi:hypothetical protein
VERTPQEPRWGEFGKNEPGSDFFFVPKELSAKLAGSSPTMHITDEVGEARFARVESAGRPSIAVLGFRNLSDRPGDAWLSIALSEWLTTELAAGEKLRAIAGENVASRSFWICKRHA